MPFADGYLNKQAYFPEALTEQNPDPDLGLSVVIPCFNEPAITAVLESIAASGLTEKNVEVHVIINSSETASAEQKKQNRQSNDEAQEWIHNNKCEKTTFFIHHIENLPKKHAGVGLARKIGMDEAIRRYNVLNRPEGIIVSLDADCLIEANYLPEIERRFQANPSLHGVNINVEHDISGLPDEVTHATILYELYMRYYVEMLRNTGFPYAFHTIGSGFAVRANAYVKQGGMSKRQGGEDFYFLQKLFSLGNFQELNSTTVTPASRLSDRVPFGTGPEIKKIIDNDWVLFTYTPKAFQELRAFFSILEKVYQDPAFKVNDIIEAEALKKYLVNQEFNSKIKEIISNTSGFGSFKKRFFQWFNAFMILKFLNFAHQKTYDKQNILHSMKMLFPSESPSNALEWLLFLRNKQKSKEYVILQ